MKALSKALVGTVVAGTMAVSSAAPAFAEARSHGADLRAGEMVAGARILGSAVERDARGYGQNDRFDRDDRFARDWRGGNPRAAVSQCVASAERQASRFAPRGRADVTDIRDVRRTRFGYEITGRIVIDEGRRGWGRTEASYGRDLGMARHGRDVSSFSCRIAGNRVVDVDFSGMHGWR